MARRLTIKVAAHPAVVVARTALRADKLVYLACANRPQRYPRGRSRIVYIGTTKNGIDRIAASAARASRAFLRLHGVRTLDFFVVTCQRRPGAQTWRKLERGLLLAFKDEFGRLPIGNTQGKNAFWDDEAFYFKPSRLRKVVLAYSGLSRRRRRSKPPRRKRSKRMRR